MIAAQIHLQCVSIKPSSQIKVTFSFQGLASYCKAETTFTFHFSIINAYESI